MKFHDFIAIGDNLVMLDELYYHVIQFYQLHLRIKKKDKGMLQEKNLWYKINMLQKFRLM
jgi:hypothetical protein